jgi:hypothetical protein
MPRFDWKSSRFAPDTAQQAECWIEALESTGIENVAQTLAHKYPAGLRAAVWIGEAQMTRGFAEHWLADKTKREARSRSWRTFWAVGSVVASGPVIWGAVFSGEVEALNTPTIRRLTPSRRHQLPRITRSVGEIPNLGSDDASRPSGPTLTLASRV